MNTKATSLVSTCHLQSGGSLVVSAGASSQIQDRQLETPLSTVDSSEGVGPKAARTLGSVELGYKVPPLLLHLCSLLDEPFDLNQNLMSQLTGLTRMDGNDECTILVKAAWEEVMPVEASVWSLMYILGLYIKKKKFCLSWFDSLTAGFVKKKRRKSTLPLFLWIIQV